MTKLWLTTITTTVCGMFLAGCADSAGPGVIVWDADDGTMRCRPCDCLVSRVIQAQVGNNESYDAIPI